MLKISPQRFTEAYNINIQSFVESKGGMDYLPYSDAIRLFRLYFPELGFGCEVNPATQGYIFEELDGRGYFVKPYVYDQEGNKSCPLYFCVLNFRNAAVLPTDKEKDGKSPTANSQLFNKAIYRSIVKVIAIETGIGLKLWTRDSLEEEVSDDRAVLYKKVALLNDTYKTLTGADNEIMSSISAESTYDSIVTAGKMLKLAVTQAQISDTPVEETKTVAKKTAAKVKSSSNVENIITE